MRREARRTPATAWMVTAVAGVVALFAVAISVQPGGHLGSEQSALTRAIIRIGRTLGLSIVAEGIELPEQAMLLRALECDAGQGYLFARPMTAEDLDELLTRAGRGERLFTSAEPTATA